MHDRDEQIRDPYATTAILSGLLPDTKYRVHIYAVTQYGRGEGMFIEIKTTDKVGKELKLFQNVPNMFVVKRSTQKHNAATVSM